MNEDIWKEKCDFAALKHVSRVLKAWNKNKIMSLFQCKRLIKLEKTLNKAYLDAEIISKSHKKILLKIKYRIWIPLKHK